MKKSNIYLTAEELFKELNETLKNESEDVTVDIATYSMYLQVTTYDVKEKYGFNSNSRRFIDTLKRKNHKHRLIVGIPYFEKKLGHIPDYVSQYNSSIDRISNTFRILKLNGRVHNGLHLKYYRIGNRIWVGGINLTSSDWVDVAHEVLDENDKKTLIKIYEDAWVASNNHIRQYRQHVIDKD